MDGSLSSQHTAKKWPWISPTSSLKVKRQEESCRETQKAYQQGQASRQEGSREESYRREKTSGQNYRRKQGCLGTQIGGLIAKHMAKMFKEDVSFYTAKQNIPVVNKADILKNTRRETPKSGTRLSKKIL